MTLLGCTSSAEKEWEENSAHTSEACWTPNLASLWCPKAIVLTTARWPRKRTGLEANCSFASKSPTVKGPILTRIIPLSPQLPCAALLKKTPLQLIGKKALSQTVFYEEAYSVFLLNDKSPLQTSALHCELLFGWNSNRRFIMHGMNLSYIDF